MQHRLPMYSRGLAAALGAVCLLAGLAPAQRAAAFCGFYVTGADSSLYSNATMVVMMRDGMRTVLSIQNNYQGPPDAFALVVPVPTVLQKENVKVLPKDVFSRVDALGSPRLVEYWEVNPCSPPFRGDAAQGGLPTAPATASAAGAAGAASPVRIEAQFAVGEYDVVVLSADDSSALDTWLRDNKYNIPDGAGDVLMPYVANGMKFFVAKVDPKRVTFNGDQAALSPLRFYYDTPEFSLPVRLGLLNSKGSQDLIVNILATQRYEVANYPNVTIPTNIRVQNEVRNSFASFYEALYSKVQEKNPKSVVTEYSWASGSCDPCPTPPLDQQDLLTLGADVLQSADPNKAAPQQAAGAGGFVPPPTSPIFYNMTLTRLHARYTKDMLGEDLVFQQAPAIVGGRGIPDTKGNMDQTVMKDPSGSFNNFQGRYVILHAWEGELTCQNPQRGQWGGPSGMLGTAPMSQGSTNAALTGAAPKAGDLSALLAESVPSLSVKAKTPIDPLAAPVKPMAAGAGGSSTATGGSKASGAAGSSVGNDVPKAPPVPSLDGKAGSGSLGTDTPAASKRKRSSGCSAGRGEGSNGFAFASALLVGAAFATRRTRRRKNAQ